MPFIAISYGYTATRENIATKVAEILGYEAIGRQILLAAAEKFHIPESTLAQAIHDAPSFFGMPVNKRKCCIAYILAAAATHLRRDKIVYHGPASHVIGQGISHVLKVRIIPDKEARVTFEMNRHNVSREEALERVASSEKQRRRLTKEAFGLDDSSPDLYDLVIDLNKTSTDDAIQLIVTRVQDRKYQPMTYSLRCAGNIELACLVKAHLVDIDPDINVRCEEGDVSIHTKAPARVKEKRIALIQERISQLPGVKNVDISIADDLFDRIAGTMR